MKKAVLIGLWFLSMLAWAAWGADGEWTQNSMPGTNTVWTAERVKREIGVAATAGSNYTRTATAGLMTGSAVSNLFTSVVGGATTDAVARAAAAYAYSPTNPPPAASSVTNYVRAVRTNGVTRLEIVTE